MPALFNSLSFQISLEILALLPWRYLIKPLLVRPG
jgi:hypothetical protein